jgi:hypothetical protein
MAVHIDRIESTVDVEPPAADSRPAGSAAPPWEANERARQVREREERDRARTRAWDHDD